MANWTALKAAIAAVIKTNGKKEITGAVLQSTLNTIVSNLGENATFKGVAYPDTIPGYNDGQVFYIASKPGIYVNFGGINFVNSGLYILKYVAFYLCIFCRFYSIFFIFIRISVK